MDRKKASSPTLESELEDFQGAIKHQFPLARMILRLKQAVAPGLATGRQWWWNQFNFQRQRIELTRMRHLTKLYELYKTTLIHQRKLRPHPVIKSALVVF
jgi:hypothetical protein